MSSNSSQNQSYHKTHDQSQCTDCGHICCDYYGYECGSSISKNNKGVDGCTRCMNVKNDLSTKYPSDHNDSDNRNNFLNTALSSESFVDELHQLYLQHISGMSSESSSSASRSFQDTDSPEYYLGRYIGDNSHREPNTSGHQPRFSKRDVTRTGSSAPNSKTRVRSGKTIGRTFGVAQRSKLSTSRCGPSLFNESSKCELSSKEVETPNSGTITKGVLLGPTDLTKNSSTIPCDSIQSDDGRKIWLWTLTPSVHPDQLSKYDGINGSFNAETLNEIKWNLNLYIKPVTESHIVNFELSFLVINNNGKVSSSLFKETTIEPSTEPRFISIEMGTLSISDGIVFLLLRRIKHINTDETFPNDMYVISISGSNV